MLLEGSKILVETGIEAVIVLHLRLGKGKQSRIIQYGPGK
jgi:hypothetical protein